MRRGAPRADEVRTSCRRQAAEEGERTSRAGRGEGSTQRGTRRGSIRGGRGGVEPAAVADVGSGASAASRPSILCAPRISTLPGLGGLDAHEYRIRFRKLAGWSAQFVSRVVRCGRGLELTTARWLRRPSGENVRWTVPTGVIFAVVAMAGETLPPAKRLTLNGRRRRTHPSRSCERLQDQARTLLVVIQHVDHRRSSAC